MPLYPGTEEIDWSEYRRSVECATCGDRAEWRGRIWKCKAGHETSLSDFPMGWQRGK